MKPAFCLLVLSAMLCVCFSFLSPFVLAAPAPPVRIAIVPGNGSGMEQEVVDRVSDQLGSNANVNLSTVNPDWTAVVTIVDKTDPIALTVRVNGTLTIKTSNGHVIDTISVQSNKQDFHLSPGTPAPMNKALVDSTAREVIGKLVERAVVPFNDAVAVEMQTRQKIIDASGLADQDKYGEALEILRGVGPETPHFQAVRELIAVYQMEAAALDSMMQAKASIKAGKLSQAIKQLQGIDPKSKRFAEVKETIAQLRRRLAGCSAHGHASPIKADSQIKALEEQKKALDAQKKAIDDQEALIKVKSAPAK